MTSRPEPLSFKPRLAGSLKSATDRLVNAVGGQGRAAELCRVSRSTIARYTDPEEHGFYMPADVIRDLEARCDFPYVTHFLGHECGFELRRIDGGSGDGLSMAEILAHAVRECSDVSISGIEALADGTVSVAEARAVQKEAAEAMKALMRVHDRARTIVHAGRGV